jgi:transcriptional regulator with GAF, ATPase, and Fis domain
MAAANTMVAGRPRTAGVTDDLASKVDDIQYRPGAGPCLHAVRDQTVVRVDSTETDQRWPAFSRAAAAKGILSSLSFPLVVHQQSIGALNCYSRIAAGFSADDECIGSTIAAAAAIALAYWDARHHVKGLGLAVPSRPTTEQTKDILMGVHRRAPTVPPTTGSGSPGRRTRGVMAEISRGHDN